VSCLAICRVLLLLQEMKAIYCVNDISIQPLCTMLISNTGLSCLFLVKGTNRYEYIGGHLQYLQVKSPLNRGVRPLRNRATVHHPRVLATSLRLPAPEIPSRLRKNSEAHQQESVSRVVI